MAPRPAAATMPAMPAQSEPQPVAATSKGRGARQNSTIDISAPDRTDAYIRADAAPAATAMAMSAIISCPAPFERLEVSSTPTIGDRTTRKPYEKENVTGGFAPPVIVN